MHNKISKINNKTFIKYISSYIIIILIMFIMGINLYKIGSNIIKNEIIKSNLTTIDSIKNELDYNFDAIATTALQINSDHFLNKLSNYEVIDNNNIMEFNYLIEQLSVYKLNQNFIDDYYIYLKKSNMILTSETLYNPEVFYKSVLKGYDPLKYDEWITFLNNTGAKPDYVNMDKFMLSGEKSENINFFKCLTPNFMENSIGTICIYFDESKLKNKFSSINIESGSFVYIEDGSGNSVSSISCEEENLLKKDIKDININDKPYITKKINNEKYLITSVQSDYNNWNYTIGMPMSLILGMLNSTKTLYMIILLISLVLCILISFFMAYGNARALQILITPLKEFTKDKYKDDFSEIKSGINTLILQNSLLTQDLEEQKPYINSAFFDKLLKGLYINKTELNATASYLNLNLDYQHCAVVLFKIYNDNKNFDFNSDVIKEFNISKTIIKNTMEQINENIILHETNHHTLALLIFSNDDKEIFVKQINDDVKLTKKILLEKYNMKMQAAAGNIYSDLINIWQSYEEACQALLCIKSNDYELMWYCDVPKDSSSYYYPVDIEQHLINFINSGDIKQCENIIATIYNENFISRSISLEMSQQLIEELKSTIIKLSSQILNSQEIVEDIKLITENNTQEENFNIISEITEKLCSLTHNNNVKESNTLINKIKDYIDKNYFHSNLNLNKISSEFNISQGYLSYLFKEQTGINYTDYLEKIRIDNACELLKTTDISIADISLNVGYNSPQSFRRAFKKIMGINPTALRKK